MILVDARTSELYTAAGFWGRLTVDALFRRQAAAHPDRPALIDAPDRARWTEGAPRRLTYAEAAAEVTRLAVALQEFGLKPGSVIALQLPNTAEAVLVTLAALRAGLVPAPLPPVLHGREIVQTLAPLAPKALIGTVRIGRSAAAAMLMDVAAELFSVRHVAVVDPDAPDGTTPLGAPARPADRETEQPCPDRAADRVASLSWESLPGGRLAARSHNQWIANASMVAAAARMDRESRILCPLLPSNSAWFAGAVIPWLLTGATLILQHPFAADCFAGLLAQEGPTHILLPGPAALALRSEISAAACATTLLRVWRAPEQADEAGPSGSGRTLELLRLGECVCLPVEQAAWRRLALPLGPVAATDAPAFCELRIDDEEILGRRRLLVRGAAVSSSAAALLGGSADPDDWRDTGCLARPAADGRYAEAPCTPRRFANVGGLRLDLQAVSTLYRRVAGRPGLRAAALSDPLLGERLVISGPDAAGPGLAEAGLSPALAPAVAPPAAA